MSGFEAISFWAFENIPPNRDESFDNWFIRVSDNFEANGRLPLSEIFDDSDISNLRDEFDTNTDVQIVQEQLPVIKEPIIDVFQDSILTNRVIAFFDAIDRLFK